MDNMLLLILYFALMLGVIALGGWAVEGIFKQHLKSADDRVKRFEEQLKEQRRGKV